MALYHISTRQVAARIRAGTLPEYSPGGKVRCACHPDNIAGETDTEALRIWAKGDRIGCTVHTDWAPALAIHEQLGIIIDTRL